MPEDLKKLPPLMISVDVEDWPQSTWDHALPITERARRNTEHVLDVLAARGKKATMFVLGKFAERFPETVRRIAREGHEVASHGYGHVEIFLQTPAEFRDDVRRCKNLLEDIAGCAVVGYRAPDFSIMPQTAWALDVLAGLGFEYDSSIFPIKEGRYGFDGWPSHPVRVRLASGRSIVELPPATRGMLGRQWPIAGGGYHRLLPWPLIRRAISDHLRTSGPFMAYCHPYEFDPSEFAALDLGVPLKMRLHQGLGRRGFQTKFERMLTSFDISPASQVATGEQWPEHHLQSAKSEPPAVAGG